MKEVFGKWRQEVVEMRSLVKCHTGDITTECAGHVTYREESETENDGWNIILAKHL